LPTNAAKKKAEEICAEILATYGLPSEIARALGISAQAVHQWKKVPPHWAHVVADVTKRTPEQIRPDIFKTPHHPKRNTP